jgi:methionyl-tRNA synthetase
MPEKAERLWDQLGEPGTVADAELSAALEAPPAEFGEPEELFEKVDEEHIEALTASLRDRVETADGEGGDAAADETDEQEETPAVEELVEERVSFERFQALDLRVGEILSAEPVEGADDLLLLEVDIGVETRQVVAGLKQLHDADELPGTRVVLAANIEEAELFGHRSNGMVLAAGDEADLLTTHGDAPLGTRVR